MLGSVSCLCSLLEPVLGLMSCLILMSGLVSCLCSLLESVLGFCSLLDLTSGLSFSPSRLIFKLVQILQLGDDISILLL